MYDIDRRPCCRLEQQPVPCGHNMLGASLAVGPVPCSKCNGCVFPFYKLYILVFFFCGKRPLHDNAPCAVAVSAGCLQSALCRIPCLCLCKTIGIEEIGRASCRERG